MTAVVEYEKEQSYRVYVTDVMFWLSKFVGLSPRRRYYDIINPQPEEEFDDRPGEEIAIERLENIGIKVVG